MSYYDFSHFAPSIGGLCYWRVGKEVEKWTKTIPLINCQMKYLEKDKIFLDFFLFAKIVRWMRVCLFLSDFQY